MTANTNRNNSIISASSNEKGKDEDLSSSFPFSFDDVGGDNDKILVVINPAKNGDTERLERLGARGGKAITITFTDTWLFKYKEQYLYNEIIKEIKKTKNIDEYILKEEHSDTGRYHLHGIIYFKTIKAITNLRRKLSKYGISQVKTINNSVKWAEYCMKNQN